MFLEQPARWYQTNIGTINRDLHRFSVVLCYWFLSDKRKVLLCTTIHNLTVDVPIYPNIQELIHYYPGSLETALGIEDFDNILDVCDSFINDDEEVTAKSYPND